MLKHLNAFEQGGTIQPKRDCDGEHGKSDKLIDSNANKTNSKVEGTSSSRTVDHRSDRHSTVHSRYTDNQLEVKKDSSDTSQNLKRHSKHPTQSDHDRRVLDHHKHHKRKHSDHGKQQSERPKTHDSHIKRTEDMNHEKSDSSEGKTSSSRPVDGSKAKVSQSGGLSSAAKHILSLPPLHHKHSLPETDMTSSSESPSKKQKVGIALEQKHKLEGEMSRVVNQVDEDTHFVNSSSTHRKPKPVSGKHKMKVSSEKHAEFYKQMHKTSDKSSHSQKHHSSVHDKHNKGKKVESLKSSSTHGLGSTDSNLKSKDESLSSTLKSREEGSQLSVDSSLSSQNSRQSVPLRKSSNSDKRAHKVSNSAPKKNGHPSKSTSKTGSAAKELSLPPPPPPPSFNVPNILASQPPLPTDPEVKQKPAPAPPDDSVSMQQNYAIPDGQIQNSVMQNQMQGQLYSMQHQVTQSQQNSSHVPHDYQQQLFSSSAQSGISSSITLTTPQLYYQGQEGSQGGTSDVSQAYWQPLSSTSLFSPNNIGLLPPPPVPPQGLVIHQVDGLPPPPPLNLPPFPPPPT